MKSKEDEQIWVPQFIGGVFMVVFVVFITFNWLFQHQKQQKIDQVSVGSTWEYCYDGEDPFKEEVCSLRTVLDVRDDYVKFKYILDSGAKVTRSSSIGVFLVEAKLIE